MEGLEREVLLVHRVPWALQESLVRLEVLVHLGLLELWVLLGLLVLKELQDQQD